MKVLPLFCYRSTVAVIDDDESFLHMLSTTLKRKNNVLCFNQVKDTLAYFADYQSLLANTFGTASTDQDLLEPHALRDFRDNRDRSKEVTTLIIDYHLNEENGLDICRALQHLPMKKLLLTGEAESTEVMQACQDRLIDGYLRKDNPMITQALNFQLRRLQMQFFTDNTYHLLKQLETRHPLYVSDPTFVDFFYQWSKQHGIEEYFLLDRQGSLLLVDEQKRLSYFIVHTDRTLAEALDLHEQDSMFAEYMKIAQIRQECIQGRERYDWAHITCLQSDVDLATTICQA